MIKRNREWKDISNLFVLSFTGLLCYIDINEPFINHHGLLFQKNKAQEILK